jgi:hypothetical protein
VAQEANWSDKQPFHDRALDNFRRLFDLGAIDDALTVKRCTELQMTCEVLGRDYSNGSSTTHMAKLYPRHDGGSGGYAFVFGIRRWGYGEG